ncbi:MAG: MerR family transcriptional regulator [Planctomycetota bacterium]|jgi:DNA-binding transcriptional MerR regulator
MKPLDITKDAFNTKQVSAIIGATVRQIGYWDKQGIVKPSIRCAAGRGTQRLYSYRDLLALKTVKSLRDDEVPLQKIRKCISFLRRHLPDVSQPLNICTLIAGGESVYLARDEVTLVDTVKRPGQYAHRDIIDIAALDRELRNTVAGILKKRIETIVVGEYAYQVEIEPDSESGGYLAEVAGLPGCVTDGDTLEEVLEMAQDAVECWLAAREELKTRGVTVPVKRTARRRKRA